MIKRCLYILLMICSFQAVSAQGQFIPLEVTGFNADLIVEDKGKISPTAYRC